MIAWPPIGRTAPVIYVEIGWPFSRTPQKRARRRLVRLQPSARIASESNGSQEFMNMSLSRLATWRGIAALPECDRRSVSRELEIINQEFNSRIVPGVYQIWGWAGWYMCCCCCIGWSRHPSWIYTSLKDSRTLFPHLFCDVQISPDWMYSQKLTAFHVLWRVLVPRTW